MDKIFYHCGKIEIELGDVVETRVLFKKTRGIVSYVPGVSPLNKEMAFNGLTYLGISTEKSGFIAVTVIPESNSIKKSIKFIERGEISEPQLVRGDDQLFEDTDGNPL